ncbi:ABC transporter permease [Candidatus Babeliales bacterium]|nr:ABC transporter permease [Candidatus Babeliales bacterium]
MNKKLKSYLKLLLQLLKTDFIILKKNIFNSIINIFISISLLLFVFAYIYPQLGMTKFFGPLFVVSAMVSFCIFEIWATTADFISDLEGNKTISYPLTLPIPSWLYFVKLAIYYACKTMISTAIIIPLGKLLLLNRMDLSHFSPIKFLIIFVNINIFAGFLSLFISGVTKNISNIRRVWTRFLFPLWFLGCADFPWKIAYKFSPKFSYILLINPITSAMEGIRTAVLGQSRFINFWLCFLILSIFTFIFGFLGIKKLKKRLDFV